MLNTLFNGGREGIADQTISLPAGALKVALVRGYTFGAAHKFVGDLATAGGSIVATSPALTTKTFADGVVDADDVTFAAVPAGAGIGDLVLFQASAPTGGADLAATAQRLIAHYDLRISAIAAAAAGATSITVSALPIDLASGSTLTFSGGTTATLSAAAATGATALTVSALGGAIASGETAMALTPNGGGLTVRWPQDAPKLLQI